MLFSTIVQALYHSIIFSNCSCVLLISSYLPHHDATILSFSIKCSRPLDVSLVTSTGFLYTKMLHKESDVVVLPSDTGSSSSKSRSAQALVMGFASVALSRSAVRKPIGGRGSDLASLVSWFECNAQSRAHPRRGFGHRGCYGPCQTWPLRH